MSVLPQTILPGAKRVLISPFRAHKARSGPARGLDAKRCEQRGRVWGPDRQQDPVQSKDGLRQHRLLANYPICLIPAPGAASPSHLLCSSSENRTFVANIVCTCN